MIEVLTQISTLHPFPMKALARELVPFCTTTASIAMTYLKRSFQIWTILISDWQTEQARKLNEVLIQSWITGRLHFPLTTKRIRFLQQTNISIVRPREPMVELALRFNLVLLSLCITCSICIQAVLKLCMPSTRLIYSGVVLQCYSDTCRHNAPSTVTLSYKLHNYV
jgi:hypothetical protein